MEKRTIEIIEGHDPSSYFWIKPAKCNHKNNIDYWENFDCYKELEISIEEGVVDCFLAYFLFKYFDDEYIYNLKRENSEGRIKGFEWYLEHNFYSFKSIELMLNDIEEKCKLLEKDYNNSILNELKERFSLYYMMDNVPRDFNDHQTAIEQNIDVVIYFYNRFIAIMKKMISEGKNMGYETISFMGP